MNTCFAMPCLTSLSLGANNHRNISARLAVGMVILDQLQLGSNKSFRPMARYQQESCRSRLVSFIGVVQPDNWLATSPNQKPDNNHHLGRNSGPKCQQKHVGVYARVCMHRKVLVAWPGSWPWLRGHINKNCGNVLHDDLACPNMATATWLHTLIINYYWSHGAIRTHQSVAI
jgi:hypothetical protein